MFQFFNEICFNTRIYSLLGVLCAEDGQSMLKWQHPFQLTFTTLQSMVVALLEELGTQFR